MNKTIIIYERVYEVFVGLLCVFSHIFWFSFLYFKIDIYFSQSLSKL